MNPERRRTLLALGLAAGASQMPLTGEAAAAAARNPILGGGGGVHHVTVRTRDWDQTLHFYQQVLGFTIAAAWQERSGDMDERLAGTKPATQRWAYLDSGNGSCVEIFDDPAYVPPAAGSTDPTRNAGDPIVHFSLRTTRVDEVCAHARKMGVTVLGDPVDFTLKTTTGQGDVVVRIGFVQGPSGEWIELLQNAP